MNKNFKILFLTIYFNSFKFFILFKMSIAIDKSLKAKAAKLREYHEAKTKSKFEENKTYFIVGCETINTKYGTTYVIETSKGEKFYANKKITKYLEANNLIDIPEGDFKPFAINTYGYKTFTNEDGEKVDYLEIQIFNVDNKPKAKPKNK